MAKRYPGRTRFTREIVSEFVAPTKKSNKVIIFCSGLPGYPWNTQILFHFAKKGYWTFLPRYRGTWESDGRLFHKSPHQDVLDIIDDLPKGFTDIASGRKHTIADPEVYLLGASFGGPAVILASTDKRVKKAVALAPVIDWRRESRIESLDFMKHFVKAAFGNGYRYSKKDWEKLRTGKFYNPMAVADEIDGEKVMIIHAADDKVVYAAPSKKFARMTGCEFVLFKKGGHYSNSRYMDPKFWKLVGPFLRKK